MVNNNGTDELTSAITGAIGGALSLSITYPLQTITTRLQTVKKTEKDKENKEQDIVNVQLPGKQADLLEKVKNLNVSKIIKSIVEKDGVPGLYAGLESAMIGMVFTNFIYYYFFEKTSNVFKTLSQREKHMLTAKESIVASSIAGLITATVTNPIWVANTRSTVQKNDKNTFAAIKELYDEDGVKALFKGLKYALILVVNPVIQYTAFEQMKNVVVSVKNRDHKKNNESLSFFLSPNWAFVLGFVSKLIATSITYPYLTIKARAHIESTASKNASTEKDVDFLTKLTNIQIVKVIKKEGLKGLYNGFFYKVSQSVLTVALLFYFKEGLSLNAQRIMKIIRVLKAKQRKVN
ncbi:hypothetical protein TPHA_0J02710 [Tetrapisispora phaffii CBS 4417]|uniref:Peroxisomal membrane protein PMP47B n=1 Tax=Tetrapisispora phaffii (strain ATCC 24235 / CBS 4417 / NBRC 1672 / NRRL Y-8282 / UCD 70-5) TaxID=1071381 RepID=G8BYZ9_TETPH|nr:hypothetical protein TPHA_0J02710 [Tetrapisispora phaffii CBS 4417]CCE65091.1 hypothetical protein TPHA_0J02710 [Tetrapisispora phaffii CBS 4417]